MQEGTMHDAKSWALDGALAGLGAGFVLAMTLTEGALLMAPWWVAASLAIDPEPMWDWVGVFLVLTAVVGALVGWGVLGTYQLRHAVPAPVAPAFFALAGWAAGLMVAGVWLGGLADWGQCSDCLCIATSPQPELHGLPLAAAWTVGTALWAPVFGVLRLVATTWRGRALAIGAAWLAAVPAVPLGFLFGALAA